MTTIYTFWRLGTTPKEVWDQTPDGPPSYPTLQWTQTAHTGQPKSSRVAVSGNTDTLLHKVKHITIKRVCCQYDAPESKWDTLEKI
jgi:hypothetical protein